MIEVVAKLFAVSGILIDVAAVVLGGRTWIYKVVAGVRGAFAWNGRRLVEQNRRQRDKLARRQSAFAEKPSFWRMYLLQSQLSGMRLQAWQIESQNIKQRAQWGLPPRSLLDERGLVDFRQLSLNTQEIDVALQDRAATGTPRDFGGASFRLFCVGSTMSLIGLLLS